MKINILHFVGAALCSMALVSCYTPRYMYSPNNTNVPNLKAQGDSKLAAYYATGNKGTGGRRLLRGNDKFNNRGLDLQAAVAVTNHWGILFNHSVRKETNSGEFSRRIDSAVVRYDRRLTELGIGYFGKFNNSAARYQIFAGYGFGQSNFTDLGKDNNSVDYTRFHEAGVKKVFVQLAWQADAGSNFTLSFVNRFNVVLFNKVNTDYTPDEQQVYLLADLDGRASVFWEPGLISNFGFKAVPDLRLELQIGFAVLASRKFIDYRTLNFSVGAIADVGRIFGKKKPTPPAKSNNDK